jgi:S-adenosylmethionine synthetase
VVCNGHPDSKFDSGMHPMVAFRFEIERAAREYCETVATTHQTAILIEVKNGVANVVKNDATNVVNFK